MFKRGYVLNSIEKDLIKEYSKEDEIFLEEIYTRQFIENFIYGSSFTEGFTKTDAQEKPFFIQQFIHHFKLELFWAIFPTLKCVAILVPSLALLYSTSTIKFFDYSSHITGHQWFWDNSSLVPFEVAPNGVLFKSTGYFFLDNALALRGDPYFKSANMVRLENEYNFVSWPCIEDSIVQSNFKNLALKWIFSQYNVNQAYFEAYFDSSSNYLDSKFALLQYFESCNFEISNSIHTENWEDFLHFIFYCYN